MARVYTNFLSTSRIPSALDPFHCGASSALKCSRNYRTINNSKVWRSNGVIRALQVENGSNFEILNYRGFSSSSPRRLLSNPSHCSLTRDRIDCNGSNFDDLIRRRYSSSLVSLNAAKSSKSSKSTSQGSRKPDVPGSPRVKPKIPEEDEDISFTPDRYSDDRDSTSKSINRPLVGNSLDYRERDTYSAPRKPTGYRDSKSALSNRIDLMEPRYKRKSTPKSIAEKSRELKRNNYGDSYGESSHSQRRNSSKDEDSIRPMGEFIYGIQPVRSALFASKRDAHRLFVQDSEFMSSGY